MQHIRTFESLLAPEKKIDMEWVNQVKSILDNGLPNIPNLIKNYSSHISTMDGLLHDNYYDLVDINIKSNLIKVRFILYDTDIRKDVRNKKINLFAKTRFKVEVFFKSEKQYSSDFKTNEDVDKHSILTSVLNVLDNKKKQRELRVKSADFFDRLSIENVQDLFYELRDLVGEYILTKTSHVNGSYLLRFSGDKSVVNFNFRKNMIVPDSIYLEVVSELNNINERLKHFSASLQFSIDNDSQDTLIVVILGDEVKK